MAKRFIAWFGALTMAWAVCAPASWIVNPGSEWPLVPAVRPVESKTNRPVGARTADGRPLPADRWDGRLYVLADRLEPLSAIRVEEQDQPALPVMRAQQRKKGGWEIETDRGTWTVEPEGLRFARRDGRTTPLFETPLNEPRLLYNGVGLTVIGSPDAGYRCSFFRNGVVELETAEPLAGNWPTSYEDSLTAQFGFVTQDRTGVLAQASDWLACRTEPSVMFGFGGGAFAYDPQGWRLEGRVYLVPDVNDLWGRVRSQASLAGLIVLNDRLEGVGPKGSGRVRVHDQNGNDRPDFVADWWLFDAEGEGGVETILACEEQADDIDAEPDTISLYFPGGLRENEIVLSTENESVGKYFVPLFSSGEESETNRPDALRPSSVLVDWNDDGLFFIGSLLSGGHLQQDTVNQRGRSWRAFDLDGDGDIDLADRPSGSQFDFEDIFVGMLHLDIDPVGGWARIKPIEYVTDHQMFGRMNVSWYNKTYQQGRYYRGARIGFEEHANLIVPPNEVAAFSNGANFFIKTSDDNMDRMTMGRWGLEQGIAWNVELDPVEVDRESPETYNYIMRYRDPWGHDFEARSIVYPLSWDGQALAWKRHKDQGDALELFPNCPWRRATTGRPFPVAKLRMALSPEGASYPSHEGMYHGVLGYMERIEQDEDGGTFVLYYSSLMGGLHLKGADWGYAAYPAHWRAEEQGDRTIFHSAFWDRSKWYHYADGVLRKDDFQGLRQIGTPEGKRTEGPLFLAYADTDGNGYFDVYSLDIDNDGLHERVLWHREDAQWAAMQQNGRRAVWPYEATFEDIPYQMAEYQRLKDRYRSGYLSEPMVQRFELSSSGVPVERQVFPEVPDAPAGLHGTRLWRPSFYAVFDTAWLPAAGVLEPMSRPHRFGWTDFSPSGFTRMGTLLAQAGFRLETLRDITPASLMPLDMLVLGHLERPLADDECVALLDWVEQGGLLVLHYTHEEPFEPRPLNDLGHRLGFRLNAPVTNRTVIIKLGAVESDLVSTNGPFIEERTVTPDNRIEHYAAPGSERLLEGLRYVSFAGRPLTLEPPMQPLLTFKDHILAAEASFGKGALWVFGANMLSDRYVSSTDYPEPGADNDLLLRRFMEKALARIPALRILECTLGEEGKGRKKRAIARVRFKGPGGRLCVPLVWPEQRLTLDDKPIDPEIAGALRCIEVPAGAHTIEIEPLQP